MATISVVVPLYNHAAYIEIALDSVLRQTSPADEILVLDDGSSDDGLAKARRMLANDARAHAESQTNVGAHVTINRLFDRARSDYVAVLNSDDFFEPTKLERCRLLAVSSPPPDLIVGEARIIDERNHLQEDGMAADWMRRALAARDTLNLPQLSLLHENWVATTSNMVISRSFWCSVGGFRDLRYCHDLDFLMTSFAKGHVAIDRGTAHIRYRAHARNTIAESIDKIRLEIAAVWANALFEGGPSLFGGIRPEAPEVFFSALEPKGLTALIAMLQCVRVTAVSASAFYDDVLRGSAAKALLDHLR